MMGKSTDEAGSVLVLETNSVGEDYKRLIIQTRIDVSNLKRGDRVKEPTLDAYEQRDKVYTIGTQRQTYFNFN